MPVLDRLDAISSVDGRYRRITEPLAEFVSERGLMKYRLVVEGEYLIYLSTCADMPTLSLSAEQIQSIRSLYSLGLEDAQAIKDIETKGRGRWKATNHDVKAVEYYMRDRPAGVLPDGDMEWIHFALTSEDVNNLAYAMILSDSLGDTVLPAAEDLYEAIRDKATAYAETPMLGRTHGQPAVPTTVGKELNVFASRMRRQIDQLYGMEILVKLNGAAGNYNAHAAAFPDFDWLSFTEDFISDLNKYRDKGKLKLRMNPVTTQIEPHDTYAEIFHGVMRLNNIVIDFDQDMWRYISDDWFKQKPVEGEVGSSTMPQKVNPIDFENSEGNLGLANALFEYFSRKLPISRLQRDLSDSTVERAFGTALGHTLIGYEAALKGLGKTAVNEEEVRAALLKHPEVIAEGIQTILRREGLSGAYEQLSAFTRGKRRTLDEFREFIAGLEVSDEVKAELSALSPGTYIGIAPRLAIE